MSLDRDMESARGSPMPPLTSFSKTAFEHAVSIRCAQECRGNYFAIQEHEAVNRLLGAMGNLLLVRSDLELTERSRNLNGWNWPSAFVPSQGSSGTDCQTVKACLIADFETNDKANLRSCGREGTFMTGRMVSSGVIEIKESAQHLPHASSTTSQLPSRLFSFKVAATLQQSYSLSLLHTRLPLDK